VFKTVLKYTILRLSSFNYKIVDMLTNITDYFELLSFFIG